MLFETTKTCFKQLEKDEIVFSIFFDKNTLKLEINKNKVFENIQVHKN
jgi:hypothetical protein